jgi:hypothetical protein
MTVGSFEEKDFTVTEGEVVEGRIGGQESRGWVSAEGSVDVGLSMSYSHVLQGEEV